MCLTNSIRCDRVDTKGIENLALNLEKMKQLHSVKLNFSQYGRNGIMRGITILNRCDQLTNKALEALGVCFTKLPHLREIKLRGA